MNLQLQRLRKEAGFKSARAFAEHIGMPPTTYTNYEQGVRKLTLEQACEFADLLHCTLDDLAGRPKRDQALESAALIEAALVARSNARRIDEILSSVLIGAEWNPDIEWRLKTKTKEDSE